MSTLRNTLKTGLTIMRSNNRLLFVGVLVFVFPILFVAIVQSFFTTSHANIQTSEKRQVGVVHDAIAVLLQEYPLSSYQIRTFIESQKEQGGTLTEIRILQKNSTGYLILESYTPEKVESYDEQHIDLYQKIIPDNESPYIFEFKDERSRTWKAIRSVVQEDSTYFIYTEHSFQLLDSVMAARQQQSYLGLTAIFIFLISLAYWFARQTDWQKQYIILQNDLKERDLFTNMIAHEFRTPLTAVRGYASFLEESKTISEQDKKYVDTIQLSAGRMLALVNDFLEVARIQSGKTLIEITDTNVQTIISSVLEALLPVAKEKNLQLMYKPLAVPVVMKTDSKRLYQVLQNLISNSIKYTETGVVEISTETSPLALTIRIKDTGMGIDASDQQKLFAPFARVGGVEKTKTPGTGLGMWITKQYVELLGGTISVESIKNVGTHVVLTFKR
jgi:signal transduction histidine kinase